MNRLAEMLTLQLPHREADINSTATLLDHALLTQGFITFPRNKNAALPVRAQKDPLTISGLKKMGPGWHLRPRAFAPQASVMASGVQDDVATSIPVSCDGVKTHVFMDDSIEFSGDALSPSHSS